MLRHRSLLLGTLMLPIRFVVSPARHRVLKAASAVVFFGLAGMASGALAISFQPGMNPDYLGGSFHRSCDSCRVDQNGLTCKCYDGNGHSRITRVNLAFCANEASITNNRAFLECQVIKRGSWTQSCFQSKVTEDRLEATCQTPAGKSNGTQINLRGCPSLNLETINGELQGKR